MNDEKKCEFCGKTGSFAKGEDGNQQIFLCGICFHLACADCIDWTASGRGYQEVCKQCSSKYVLFGRQSSIFFGEPRFWNGEHFIFPLDKAELYSPEHLIFLKQKEGECPMTVKAAILLQQDNVIPFLEEGNIIDEIIDEDTDVVHYAEGKMDITCSCGFLYATQFTWVDNDDEEFGEFQSDPCPNCGKTTNMRIYVMRNDLNLGTKNTTTNNIIDV